MAIWNLGSINIDHVYRLPHLPQPGETLAATDYAVGLGGKGANQSVAGARAGATVHHVGAIGAADGWVAERMAGYGVDTRHIARRDDVVSGHALILVDETAENEVILHPGANRVLEPATVTAALAGIGAGDTLLLQNETNLQAEAAALARRAGARVIASAAPFEPAAIDAVAAHVSILALNEGEAAALAASGRRPAVGAMLVTLGAAGAEYRDLAAGTVQRQAAFRVDPVDTTGAGDCFAGNFAAAIDRGADVAEALRYAAAAAAIQVTRPGAGDAMPTRAEVERFLAEQG